MGNYMITLWLKGFDMILPFFRVWSRRVYGSQIMGESFFSRKTQAQATPGFKLRKPTTANHHRILR